MNAFQRAAAMHARAASDVYGEPVRFEPQRSTGRMTAGSPDPERPVREPVTVTVTAPAAVIGRKGEGAENGDNARVVARRYVVGFEADLAARLDVRPGDLVVRLNEPGRPTLRLGEPQSITGRALFPAEQVA